MSLQIKTDPNTANSKNDLSPFTTQLFSKDYVDFLDEAGWKLEKKLPSNNYKYSDLLEDTDWKSNNLSIKSSIHIRRDLDALS
tara:strand:+ start:4026 stop:4274 length:249 start_codon:yes stop_codon:yes gene_type:complete